MQIIGLTGGIGSGKSTVSATLTERGAVVLNADLVGHEAYLPHRNVWQEVVDAFGREVLNEQDEVDRRKLGAIVFGSPEALRKLNSIVHPWMFSRMREMLQELEAKGTQVAVLEAAILIEANWTPLVDQVWVTVASEENVIQRLQARSGLTPDEVRARMRAQMSSEERAQHAQVVIDTNCTIPEVQEKVRELWEMLVAA